jgi:hypothetical protein
MSLKQKGPTFENLESKWKKNFQINFAKKSLRSKNYGKGSKLYEETTFFAINVGNSWKKHKLYLCNFEQCTNLML